MPPWLALLLPAVAVSEFCFMAVQGQGKKTAQRVDLRTHVVFLQLVSCG